MQRIFTFVTFVLAASFLAVVSMPSVQAQQDDEVLSPTEWRRVDASVERALSYLAASQQRNGSFPTAVQGQPGVTSLCVMAFVRRDTCG